MCRRQEEDNTPKEKQLEDGLIAIVKAQLETHKLWEIDECVRILFELSHEENEFHRTTGIQPFFVYLYI